MIYGMQSKIVLKTLFRAVGHFLEHFYNPIKAVELRLVFHAIKNSGLEKKLRGLMQIDASI